MVLKCSTAKDTAIIGDADIDLFLFEVRTQRIQRMKITLTCNVTM